MLIKLQGRLEQITYTNEGKGFTVAGVKVPGRQDLVCVVENLVGPMPGEKSASSLIHNQEVYEMSSIHREGKEFEERRLRRWQELNKSAAKGSKTENESESTDKATVRVPFVRSEKSVGTNRVPVEVVRSTRNVVC